MKKLPSYYDLNFYILVDNTCGNKHVTSLNKEGYVLKILNANESAQPDNVGKFLRFMFYRPNVNYIDFISYY